MSTIWGNCKLDLKLQAAFGLVMLFFVAALVGIFALNAKVEALATFQSTTLIPARSAGNRLALGAATADDDGAYYIMARRPDQAAERLAKYRLNVAAYQTNLVKATKLADSDEQRAMIAAIHTAADGPKGWLHGSEAAFALKAAGKFDAAERVYFDSPPDASSPQQRNSDSTPQSNPMPVISKCIGSKRSRRRWASHWVSWRYSRGW